MIKTPFCENEDPFGENEDPFGENEDPFGENHDPLVRLKNEDPFVRMKTLWWTFYPFVAMLLLFLNR